MGTKTAGVGHFAIPTSPAAGTSIVSGAANTYTTTYVQLIASTAAALYITGIYVESAAAVGGSYTTVQLATGGAGSETIIGQYLVSLSTGSTTATGYRTIHPPIPVAVSTRISAKTADSVGSITTLTTLECIAQTNVVDDGIAVSTVTTVTNQLTAAVIASGVWKDTTAGDFTVASSIGKSVMNGVSLGTGLTVNTVTNQLTAAAIASGVWKDTTASDFTTASSVGLSVMNGVSLGTGLTVNTVTNQLTAAAIATGVWTDTTAGDFTTNLSVGKSLMAGTALGTSLSFGVVGDLSSTMKTSVTTAATAATPTAAAVTGAVGSVTGNVGGSVASVVNIAGQSGDAYAATVTVGNSLSTDLGIIDGNIAGVATQISNLNNLSSANVTAAVPTAAAIATSVLTTAMTEAYPTQGSTFSLAKGMYQLVQDRGQASVTGTTKTLQKRDGTTAAKTFTLNDATNPTSVVETT